VAVPRVSWRELRPHWAWYFTVPLPAIAGVAVAIVLFVITVGGAIDEVDRFDVPGVKVVELEADETKGLYVNENLGVSSIVNCVVVDPQGVALSLDSPTGSFEINQFEAVSQFETIRSGPHRITCTGEQTEAAIGPEPDVFGLIGSIFSIVLAPIGGLLLAAGVWGLIFFLRYRDRRRPGGMPPGGMPPPSGPPSGFMNA
jgi:hypothetical protein